MMVAARPPPSLQDMTGDEQAVALDWFELYAQDLPGPVDAELRAISAAVFKKFKRARLPSRSSTNALDGYDGSACASAFWTRALLSTLGPPSATIGNRLNLAEP